MEWVNSPAYNAAEKNQKLCFREFATDPCATLFQRFFTRFNQQFTSNTMVNISKLDRDMISLTETPQPIIFDKDTLETIGPYSFNDEFQYNLHTAHPHKDNHDQSMINLGIRMGRKTYYEFFKVRNNQRQLMSSLRIQKPSYQHSFAMTENYLIIIDTPFKVTPLAIRFGTKSFINHFKWHKNTPTIFHIFNIKTGKKQCTIKSPPFFMFHQVNAFEKNVTIVFDTIAFKNATIIDALYLDNLRKGMPDIPAGKLKRFILDPKTHQMISKKTLLNESIALPNINYKKYNGKPYSWAYALNTKKTPFFNRIIKINVETWTHKFYEKEDCIPSEPIFIQHPAKNDEDDGIILSVLFNTKTNTTQLHGIDAKTMSNKFTSTIRGLRGYTLHGQFFKTVS